jgi:cell filamentation protein
VTFDPFGDFATEGYLRNFEKEKDLAIVKQAENGVIVIVHLTGSTE